MGNSAPCCRCLARLKKLGLRRVYYSFDGTNNLRVEKLAESQTQHVSAKYRRPWSLFNEQKNRQKNKEKNIKGC